jgi:Dual-action HEIGH metallo-peptidase
MKRILFSTGLVLLLTGTMVSCKKTTTDEAADAAALSQDEKALVKDAGFNSNWAAKTDDGNFLIEGDILLTKQELQDMVGVAPAHNIIVADEEHYRTTNVVSVPSSGARTITVRLGSGFPSYYSTALNNALTRYNNLNLRIRFQRVSTGGNIVIGAANLGTAPGGGCILGQASGFPTGGNPSGGFTLSNSSCATAYLNTTDKADEVMAHEIGHCIGFRHTDYINRASCGPGGGEGAGSIGAIRIPGTPGTVSGSYNSWMMACTNGSPTITSTDAVALNYVY